MNNPVKCNICNEDSAKIFTKKILKKYDVDYFKCIACGFIQTDSPFWLSEAYSEAITNQDIGLISRNINLSKITNVLLKVLKFEPNATFLDYGGGYGMFVRQMRDYGYDYFRYDTYCENIFAKNFDRNIENMNFNMVTAFEVFEHLENPKDTIEQILSHTDLLFFSTEIQPAKNEIMADWWYIMENTGQHISLYSLESLKYLASKNHFYFYTNEHDLHLYSKKKINKFIISIVMNKYSRKICDLLFKNRTSLLMSDYNKIK